MRKLILLGTITVLSACSANTPPSAPAAPATPSEAPAPTAPSPEATATPAPMPPSDATPPADNATPAFVDKVWRVEGPSAVEPGTTYAFLSSRSLVIDAPHGTPMTGSWRYADGKLTMTEEGIAYLTDIVSLDANHFTIRSHNPGGTVEIAMVAATDVPLPSAK
ncbi:MAG TPA: hypothetical protein VHF02_03005 [Luteimonas sp.]|nr:hypothetical protein [Luteimonas sp.]